MNFFCPPKDKKYVRRMEELAELAARGATIFKDFIDTYEELSDQEKGQRVADIKELEHRCDELSHIINMRLQHAHVTQQHTLLNISAMLAVIMDSISSVSKQMVLFRIKATNAEIQQFTLLVNNGAKELVSLLKQVSKPSEARKTIVRIHGIEREADYVYNLALADLFMSKREAKDIIILKDIYEILETIVDNIEYTSQCVEHLI